MSAGGANKSARHPLFQHGERSSNHGSIRFHNEVIDAISKILKSNRVLPERGLRALYNAPQRVEESQRGDGARWTLKGNGEAFRSGIGVERFERYAGWEFVALLTR